MCADRRALHTPTARRLQLGLASFAALVILLHVVHITAIKTISWAGLAVGAVTMGATLAIPAAHYARTEGSFPDLVWAVQSVLWVTLRLGFLCSSVTLLRDSPLFSRVEPR